MPATKGNDNASKDRTGKAMTLYVPAVALVSIKKTRQERGEEDTSEAACLSEARKYAQAGIEDRTGPVPKLDQLHFMISSWQALSNHAEVFAPELAQNDQWIAMKRFLEQQNDALGTTAFIKQVGERYREKIESEEEE